MLYLSKKEAMPIMMIIFCALVFSCARRKEISPDPAHYSRISIDYEGIYRGILPSAKGMGIETIIELLKDDSYIKKVRYLGETDSTFFTSTGVFYWDSSGGKITLSGEIPPNSYQVGENVLFHLDISGNRIQGELAEHYRLYKQLDSQD